MADLRNLIVAETGRTRQSLQHLDRDALAQTLHDHREQQGAKQRNMEQENERLRRELEQKTQDSNRLQQTVENLSNQFNQLQGMFQQMMV